MRIAYLVRDNKLADYPADLMINGEVYESFNLEFEVEVKQIDFVVGKSMPSNLINALRKKGVTFIKVSSFDELKDANLNPLNSDGTIKRGNGCQIKFK